MFFSCFQNFHTLFNYIFWRSDPRVSLNVATNGSLTRRKTSKMSILRLLFSSKNRWEQTNQFVFSGWFFNVHTLNKYTFSGNVCARFTESNHQWFFSKTKEWNQSSLCFLIILARSVNFIISRSEFRCFQEECDKKAWNAFDQFDINLSCSATYFLEVAGHVSYRVSTTSSLRGKDTVKI